MQANPTTWGYAMGDANLMDFFALAVTLATVILALMSVIIAWTLGRKYSDHVDEIRVLRMEHVEIIGQLREGANSNSQYSVLLRLGIHSLFALHMLSERRERFQSRLSILDSASMFAGRSVSDDALPGKRRAIEREISIVNQQMQARIQEIYILTSEKHLRDGYINALVEKFGDAETVSFFSKLSKIKLEGWEAEKFIIATAELRRRSNGLPTAIIDSSAWTGLGEQTA